MAESYLDRNDAARRRLSALIGGLRDGDDVQPAGGGWGVSTLLGHMAFFDRLMLARWRVAERAGLPSPGGLPDGMTDLINDAGPGGWGALSAPAAGLNALEAATAVDGFLAGVDPAVAAAAIADGRASVVDRSIHRNEHLDEIDRLLRRR